MGSMVEFGLMRKDARVSLRVPADLKQRMEAIAGAEGRTVAQICEAFLRAGSEGYKKQGANYLQRFLSKQE
jgi:predicted DNA-binding protein